VTQIDERRVHQVSATVDLTDLAADGHVLDLGGGGEGYVARQLGPNVVAIDISEAELLDAPVDCIKVVMDAANLTLARGTFGLVTSFFSLMYITPEKRPRVFTEAFRVLRPGGVFRIWDATIPPRGDAPEDIFVINVSVAPASGSATAGYGCRWERAVQDCGLYRQLAIDAGFVIEQQTADDASFALTLRKPA
jgi:SAM-dependent methyltransferase